MKWTIINSAFSNWIVWILIIWPSAVTGKVVWTWVVCQSIHSFCPSETWHGVNDTCGVVFDCELDFLGKILNGQKWSKWLRKRSFQQENFCHQFLLKLFSISPFISLSSFWILSLACLDLLKVLVCIVKWGKKQLKITNFALLCIAPKYETSMSANRHYFKRPYLEKNLVHSN